MPINVLHLVLYISVGVIIGIIIMEVISRMGLNKNQQKADLIIKEANIEAENVKRQAVLDGKNAAYELKLQAEKEIKKQRQEVNELENKLLRRDDALSFREEKLQNKEKSLDDRLENVKNKTAEIDRMKDDLQKKIDVQIVELERVANLTAADARKELFAKTFRFVDKFFPDYRKNRFFTGKIGMYIKSVNKFNCGIYAKVLSKVMIG